MAELPPDEPQDTDEIKVTDRRQFTPDGERVTSDEATRPEATPESSPEDGGRPEPGERAEGPAEEGAGSPPGVPDFSTLVMSLATAALLHLGEIADPAHPGQPVDLPRARETIDILGMLQEKTKGNLTPEEQNLLDNWLCTLRTSFSKKAAAR